MNFDRAPVIETARLRLRPHRKEDYQDFAAMWRDPDVLRYTIREPRSPQDAWMTLQRLLGSWPFLGYGFWALAWRESDRYIGDCGFMDAMRPTTPDKRGVPEVGYALVTARQGAGLMSEALGAVHAWLDREMPGTATFALIDDENLPSIRAAQKSGYAFERRHDDNDRKGALYARKPLPRPGGGD